jgi:hypothetical protein
MSVHGVSMFTFMKQIKHEEMTLIICEDEKGHKFGAMCFEEWVHREKFYGTGESFVFSFHDTDFCKIYTGTGNNQMYQYMDKTCIGIGGDKDFGRFALYIGDEFRRGSSAKTRCYNNETLAHKQDFICAELEVWGLS